MFHIVLYQPQIPQNTGNIARTCAVTGTRLHLIRPYGFSINEKNVKRAGLDYWNALDLREYRNFDDFLAQNTDANIFLLTSHGNKNYSDQTFHENDYFVFGSETEGLPDKIHQLFPSSRLRIPMLPLEQARCLNLGNSVGIVLYEAMRQTGFHGLM
jgi:tRNA (cytidine/uridine-2'-O-)-methyltransferase